MSSGSRALHVRRLTAKYSRWVHIYLSMTSFGVVFFFAVTGLTLNHPQWFEKQQRTSTRRGSLDASWTRGTGTDAVKKLEVVEYLRRVESVRGALGEFRVDDRECDVSFKGPGYSADAVIDRATGTYELTENRMGLAAVVNDLHKGRDTGLGWKMVIDGSAVLLGLVSLSGLLLLWFVHRHRVAGFMTLAAAALLVYVVYAIWGA